MKFVALGLVILIYHVAFLPQTWESVGVITDDMEAKIDEKMKGNMEDMKNDLKEDTKGLKEGFKNCINFV